ncbi:MAG TPA: nitrile hydratase subunit alpha, partial [Stellaceae bacterium]|nr:nitrile hydratase subunit alpha [Stellaceae bacterium]
MTSYQKAHDHEHDHRHDIGAGEDERLTHYQVMEVALRELLIAKGIVTADDIRRGIEAMDARTPAQGARVVARAWTDPAYKARL